MRVKQSRSKWEVAQRIDDEMKRLQRRWATLLKRKMKVIGV